MATVGLWSRIVGSPRANSTAGAPCIPHQHRRILDHVRQQNADSVPKMSRLDLGQIGDPRRRQEPPLRIRRMCAGPDGCPGQDRLKAVQQLRQTHRRHPGKSGQSSGGPADRTSFSGWDPFTPSWRHRPRRRRRAWVGASVLVEAGLQAAGGYPAGCPGASCPWVALPGVALPGAALPGGALPGVALPESGSWAALTDPHLRAADRRRLRSISASWTWGSSTRGPVKIGHGPGQSTNPVKSAGTE